MTDRPIHYDPALRHWVVQDPAWVRRVLLDPATYRPDNAVVAHTPLGVPALRMLAGVGFALPPTLANNAGPSHRPIRQTVARFFSPARVAGLEPRARRLFGARVAAVERRLASGATVDLVADVAAEPPALLLLEMLGLTGVDVATLKRWSLDSLELFWGWPDPVRQLELARSAAAFYAWLREQATAARRRRHPGDDLFGALTRIEPALPDEEICAVGYFLLIAGQETTSQLISTAYAGLVGRPAADAGEYVDRVLRTTSSVPTWRRITACPAELDGTKLPSGAPVLVGLTGAGGPSELAFGVGVHRCLGARLARLEAVVATEAAADLLPRLRRIEPDPPMIDLLSFRAPARLLVTLARRR